MSWLAKTDKVFKNAENRLHRLHKIPTPKPIEIILSNTRICFSLLEDEDDDSIKQLKWMLWNLRQSVVLSLLPFDSKSLGLTDLLEELNAVRKFFPTVDEQINEIAEASKILISEPFNPKRRKVLELLADCRRLREAHGLVSLLSRGSVMGWGEVVSRDVKQASPECVIISSQKILLANVYDRIIIPSGGKFSPISSLLLNCSYSKVTDAVAYDREHVLYPKAINLPVASKTLSNNKLSSPEEKFPKTENGDFINWEKSGYWEGFRSRIGVKEVTDSDFQYPVKARLVILPENQFVYLVDSAKVINLTALIGETPGYIKQIKKFPRTVTSDLCEGNLIVIRTSGSGDYLLDVAEMLMKKSGCDDLKESALEWKSYLTDALQKEGALKVFNLLKKKGHDFCSHMYLWEWTTSHVIGPANDSKFFELMAILDDLGYIPKGIDVVQYAEEKWNAMKELKRFHQRAGAYIRKELMNEIKRVLETGTSIGDKLSLNIKGASSGTLSVLRVVGVDPESQMLPYSEIGVLRNIGG